VKPITELVAPQVSAASVGRSAIRHNPGAGDRRFGDDQNNTVHEPSEPPIAGIMR
jgi:hypothetical protein